jgi:hypothetical protein
VNFPDINDEMIIPEISPLFLNIWATKSLDVYPWAHLLKDITSMEITSDGKSFEKFHAKWLALWECISPNPPSYFKELRISGNKFIYC